jgi:catechol 2,3-dioxygenase-like lactoylglutathione lyase family enzyme
MTGTPTLDHIAFTTPDLDGLIERLTGAFGMTVQVRTDQFAVVADPGTGLTLELGRSADEAVHFRHLGFRTEDVDGAHQTLVEAGLEAVNAPHRRDFARMYTSFLKLPGAIEAQLVKYD